MELIQFPIDQLFTGMSLRFALRDEAGQMLLAKGQKIDTAQQLEAIKSRGSVFVELDQTGEGVRAIMSSLSALNQVDAPIKDFSVFLATRKNVSVGNQLTRTLVEQWDDAESELAGLLGSVQTSTDFANRVQNLARSVLRLQEYDANGSQFLLFHRAVTHYEGYSVLHALLCASLCASLSQEFALSQAQQSILLCAALTMNVAMTHLQNVLALQTSAPSANQRASIQKHAELARKLLEQAGVTDQVWLEVVRLHHTNQAAPAPLKDWPALARMVKILQTVDRYCAAVSPRKSRAGRTARDSVRSVVVQAGDAKYDEVGTALIRLLGLSPPGTYVKLINGETAVVLRRGDKPATPMVASVLNRQDERIAEPRLRDTSLPALTIQSTLTGSAVLVRLNLELMLRLIPK